MEAIQKEMTKTLAAIKLSSSRQCSCTHGTLCLDISREKQPLVTPQASCSTLSLSSKLPVPEIESYLNRVVILNQQKISRKKC